MRAGPGTDPAARYAVYFTPTFKLVQQLLAAKKELRLDAALKKLDRFDAIILDDLGYVQQSREEMEVLFTFLAERYERRSVLVSSNLVFSKWDQIFKDPMTTMAAVDRLVHHAIILEFDGESHASATRQERKGRQLTRRARQPLRLRYVFGAWRRQRLRSAEGAGPEGQRQKTNNETKQKVNRRRGEF